MHRAGAGEALSARRKHSEAWLAAAAARRPDDPALEAGGEVVAYADLLERARRAARRLAGRGVAPGDRVAIALTPGLAFVEAFHGCLLAGAVAMPIDVRLGETERAAQIATAATVVDEPLAGSGSAMRDDDEPLAGAERAMPETGRHDPADVAVVVHTSGTTGAARPVELTYGNFEASAAGSAARLGLDPAERWLSALPLSHVGGLSIVVRSAIYATTAIVHERFEVDAVAAALESGGVTLVSLVPTTLTRLVDAGARPGPTLRCALIGGGPLSPDQATRATAAGFPLAQTYGLTEACSQVTTSPIGDPSTAGPPLDGTEVRIAPDGEILVAGPTVAPRAAAADGFLHTGDLGLLDDRGRLTLTGRRSEMVVTGGENVAAAEVEAVLETHPAVREAAVYGRPHTQWGEALAARVVLVDGRHASAQELRAHCAAALAPFKVPKRVDLVSELPRTPSGKLRRDLLR